MMWYRKIQDIHISMSLSEFITFSITLDDHNLSEIHELVGNKPKMCSQFPFWPAKCCDFRQKCQKHCDLPVMKPLIGLTKQSLDLPEKSRPQRSECHGYCVFGQPPNHTAVVCSLGLFVRGLHQESRHHFCGCLLPSFSGVPLIWCCIYFFLYV